MQKIIIYHILFSCFSIAPMAKHQQPIERHCAITQALHDEFYQKAPIRGLVSYLYYPKRHIGNVGHAEIEIEGYTHDPMNGNSYPHSSSLSGRIAAATNNGMPFFRFFLTVTPRQMDMIKQYMPRRSFVSCSEGALTMIAECGGPVVPQPFS
jgi:hypothetical protein